MFVFLRRRGGCRVCLDLSVCVSVCRGSVDCYSTGPSLLSKTEKEEEEEENNREEEEENKSLAKAGEKVERRKK